MKNSQFKLFAFWGFLIGIVVVVFIQFLYGQNVNRLIQANKSLQNEIRIQNDLRKVESEIFTVESNIRGAIISGNPAFLRDVEEEIRAIHSGLGSLEQQLRTGTTSAEVRKLRHLVNQKIDFSHTILKAFYSQGKDAAEDVINTDRGRLLRDSIVIVISSLDTTRHGELDKLIFSIEKSGTQARTWGFVLAALACILLVFAFWYIISQTREQHRMIQSLNESERRIKEASELKEQFVANMSHEIRTPMNAIIGFTNLLKRTNLDHDQRQYVQNIHTSGENLLTLVNDILDLSKIEAGMMQLEEIHFSLRSLISSVGAMFVEKIKEKSLEFVVHIDNHVPDILSGDAVRLTQVLVNLISNAIKFTESGSVALKVDLLSLSERSTRIRITVADTGIGIPAVKQAAIFERFQQAEAETTRRFGGTGLGLAIVRQLVTLQKGTINLQSEPGKGSSFIIELGFSLPDEQAMLTKALANESEPVMLDQIKVLIAEDNPMNQQLIRHLMKSWNVDFTLVNNGAEAVAAIKEESFSVVLMDIQMPEMDGYVATTVIRNELQLDIPIIAMTAHAMVGEKEKCLQLGMNDYVSKPIKENVLFNVIAQYSQHGTQTEKKGSAGVATPLHEYRFLRFDYLQELSAGNKEFENMMLQQFVETMPEELETLQQAFDANDLVNVRRIAHSLKSSVSYVGLADELFPFLGQIEEAAADERPDDIPAPFTYIKNYVSGTLEEVKSYLQDQNVSSSNA